MICGFERAAAIARSSQPSQQLSNAAQRTSTSPREFVADTREVNSVGTGRPRIFGGSFGIVLIFLPLWMRDESRRGVEAMMGAEAHEAVKSSTRSAAGLLLS